jgi:hypothetical protein
MEIQSGGEYWSCLARLLVAKVSSECQETNQELKLEASKVHQHAMQEN